MTPEKILVTTIGASIIGFIYWFFFGNNGQKSEVDIVKKDKKGNSSIEIVVDGGYKPAVIFIEKGVKTTLKIIRKDPNTCLSDIILPDFKLSKYLPLNKEVGIDLTPEKEGEYQFHCGMNMFHGRIVVN
jgi:plastocyanin domain-containing protein